MAGLRLLIVAIGALLYGVLEDWPAVTLVASCAIIAVILAFLMARVSLNGIAFSRRLASDKVMVGDSLHETLRLENRSALAKLFVEIHDRSTLPLHKADRVTGLGARSSREWDIESVVRVRGHHRIGPVSIRSGDPIGLFRRQRILTGAIDVTVYPMTVALDGYTPTSALQSGGGVIQRRSTVPTAAVGGIRDYTSGDSINRISWTATARAGHLMVKEFEIDPTADLWVVLDLTTEDVELIAATATDLQSDSAIRWLGNVFEYRIMLTGSLVRRTLGLGRSVGIVINAPNPIILPPERSDRQFVRILEHLAVVQPVSDVSMLEVLTGVHHRFTRDSAVVLVTSHPTAELSALLGQLRRRNISPELVIVDDGTSSDASIETASRNRVPCYRLTRFDNPDVTLNSALLMSGAPIHREPGFAAN